MRDEIIELLKKVEDPELMIDVWTLGLIYKVEVEGEKVHIVMTFTSPLCPYGRVLVDDIEAKIAEKGLKPRVEVTFDPPWQPSDEVKDILGMPF